MIIHISSFNQVELIPRSLLVFDIDETILSFEDIDEGWWKKKFSKHYNQTQDYDLADELSLKEWITYIENIKPQLLDQINFIKLLNLAKETNCEIIILTARKKFLFDATISHLTHCNINIDCESIYFNENKGEELYNIVTQKYPTIKNIIFIDDLISNLVNVQNKFKQCPNYTLRLYNINHYDKPLIS